MSYKCHINVNYSAPFAMLAPSLKILTVGDCNIEGVDAVPMRQRSVD